MSMIRTILYITLHVRHEYVITRHTMLIIYTYTAYIIFFYKMYKNFLACITGYIWIFDFYGKLTCCKLLWSSIIP